MSIGAQPFMPTLRKPQPPTFFGDFRSPPEEPQAASRLGQGEAPFLGEVRPSDHQALALRGLPWGGHRWVC